jgi:hypothetical protein
MRLRLLALVCTAAAATAGLATVPAIADAPIRQPLFVRLSDAGPAFLAYDGDPSFDRRQSDWPVSLVFAGNASVGKVKRALGRLGFNRRGHTRYLAYRVAGQSARFDGDRGLKTRCDGSGTDVHVRLYAPPGTDHLTDPRFGNVVVATAHLDRGEAPAPPPRLFGFSEEAERRVADALAGGLGWRVQRDALPLGNAEPFRHDLAAPDHVWWSDGRATLISVP